MTTLSRRLFLALVSLVVVFAAFPMSAAQSKNWKNALKADLEAAYPPTVLARNRLSITGQRTGPVEKPGIVLVVAKPGILAGGIDYGVGRLSTVRNGTLTRIFQQAEDRQYLLKPGDRVYVMSVDVDDDAIALRLMTAMPIEKVVSGTTISDRYNVTLKFEYDKASLPTAGMPALQEVIAEFLTTEEQAASANTKTIALGQTRAEVESILGKPTTVIDLGSKVILVYPNMKVILADGKVSDVQ